MAGDRMSLQRVSGLFKSMPVQHRIIVAVSLAACLILLLAWAFGAVGGTSYEALFTDLQPADAAEIIGVLDADGTPYRVGSDGSTVLVPSDQVHALRLSLAAQGMPRGGVVGYELLDRSKIGSTEFERRMGYLRALQGELTRTINQVEGVRDARVHIVIPEPSLFVSEQREPTAAVMLHLQAGVELAPDRVRGIAHLVASSVEGLVPADVTIVDTYGRILDYADHRSSTPGITLGQMETQTLFEQDLERRLESLLQRVFGPGNAIARVTANLNFDEKTVERSLFIPGDGDGLVHTLHEVEEHFSGEGAMPGGVAGTAGNIADPPVYQETAGTGSSEYERREVTRQVEFNRTYENQVVAPGTVQRLTVSVVLNQELAPAETEMVQTMVATAIGFDDQRRDVITVTGMQFDTTLVEQMQSAMEAETTAREAQQRQWMIIAGAVLGLAMLLALATRRRKSAAVRQSQLELQRMQQPEQKPEDTQTKKAHRDVERLVRQQPETVANLVRAWLAEE